MTLEELLAAYKSGAITEPMWLDNDSTFVYQEDEKVFDGGVPRELLEQALTLLGIPFQSV